MKTTKMKKIVSTGVLTLLLLCTMIIHGLAFADPLQDEKNKLTIAITNMGLAMSSRQHYYTDFSTKKSEFNANLEELQRDNLIDFVDVDPLGLFAVRATVKSALDFQDHLTLTIELHVAWSAANEANNKLAGKITIRNQKYRDLLEAAAEQSISLTNEDLEELRGDDPDPSVLKFTDIIGSVAEGMLCPNCNVLVKDAQEISSHVSPCSVPPHEGEGISHFVCNGGTCPLSSKHHVACGGGCGDLFPPKEITPVPGYPPKITRYDHFVECKKDVAGPVPCNKTYYSCQTEGGLCPRDTKHLISGACDQHKVEKGDAAAIAAHARLEGAPVACTVTLPNSDDGYGNPIRCIIRDTYVCSQHTKGVGCDFYDGVGTYPPGYVVSPPPTPTPTDNTPNCSDCTTHCNSPCNCTNSGTCNGTVTDNTPDCSYCTSGCSSCDSDDDDGLTTCGGCGVSYDPDSTSAVNLHRLRTCRFSECRQTWRRCQSSAPLCLKPYRQQNGMSCYAEE